MYADCHCFTCVWVMFSLNILPICIFRKNDFFKYSLPVNHSSGRRIDTVNQLNMSWTVAPANARRKSFLLVICPIETMVLVTEVPMFAPITMGIAFCTGITGKKGVMEKINQLSP